ncbi:MAG: SDR family NAD(P)-dependent oxidoreductase [Halodesulfurarchaeum sp.]
MSTGEYDHTPVTVEGKTAVVFGGTSGIGRAIALGFAEEGADVVATSRRESAVETTAEALRARGADTLEVTCDVTDRDSVRALREAAFERFDGIDILVNSAGAVARKHVTAVEESEWDDVMDTVLDGVYRAIQEFGREMDDGSIINISSVSGMLARSEIAAYSAAKAGVDGLTRAASRDLAPDVRVNAIAPGYVMTPLTEDAYGEGTEIRERIDERTPLGRVAEPEEMVGAALYLASDAASFTTGVVHRIDGGFAEAGL